MACRFCRKPPPIVAVYPGGLGLKCNAVKGCKSKTVFFLCGDDGRPKSSRLQYTCCAKHLPRAVRLMHVKQKMKA